MALAQVADVEDVAADSKSISDKIKILIVHHPKGLSDDTLRAIDQFVMRGGRLMVMVDPHSEGQASAPSPTGEPPRETASNLAKLLDAFERLLRSGASILIIEHNMEVIRRADWVIDLGPEGGESGGRVVAAGSPEDVVKVRASSTGAFLASALGHAGRSDSVVS